MKRTRNTGLKYLLVRLIYYFSDARLVLKHQVKLQKKQVIHIFVKSRDQFGCIPWKVK